MGAGLPTVVVEPAPPYVTAPVLAWPEAVVLALFVIAVAAFAWPLARALWPGSKTREVTARQSRRWIAAFIAFPILAVAGYLVNNAVDDHYHDLQAEREQEIDVRTADTAEALEAQSGLALTGDSVQDLWWILNDTHLWEETLDVTATAADGEEVPCVITIVPEGEAGTATMACPAP